MKWAFALLLVGCVESGSQVVEVPPSNEPLPQQPIPATPPPMQAVVVTPFQPGEVWSGTYVCAQGPSQVAVRIRSVRGSVIAAVFEFVVPQHNVAGSYELRGQVGESEIAFVPGRWIDQPPNYITVGFRGNVTSNGTFSGMMDNSSCTTINLRRQ